MALARLVWTIDTAIGHLPDLLAQLASASLFTLFVVSYAWLALVGLSPRPTAHRRLNHPPTPPHPGDTT